MKINSRNFMTCLILFALVLGETSCATKSSENDQNSAEGKEVAAQAETEVEEVPQKEDKSKRPSPPAQASGTIDGVSVLIDYSQPAVKERTVWGELVPYGNVWRTGANEASWIEFDKAVVIGGKELAAGKYGLFSIPAEGDWTIIFNEQFDQWGAYQYSEEKDVARISVTPTVTDASVERLTFTVDDKVNFAWEKMSWSFDVKAAVAE